MKDYQFGYAEGYSPSEQEEEKIEKGIRVMKGKNEVALFCQTDYRKTYAHSTRQGLILWVDDNVQSCARQLAKEFGLEEIQDSYINSPFT